MSKLFVIWDESNIYISARENVLPIMEPNANKRNFKINRSALLELVAGGREIEKILTASGSNNMENGVEWQYYKNRNEQVVNTPLTENGELGIPDCYLQLAMHRIASDYRNDPGTIALLTGDGAGGKNGEGFFADIKRFVEQGWKFELYSWEASCHKAMMKYAQEMGSYIKLDDHYFEITFVRDERPLLHVLYITLLQD